MKTLLELSVCVNWAYSTRNTSSLLDYSARLFNYVLPQNKGGQILLQLEDNGEAQMVGAAFSFGAIMFNNGDPSVNSVMAENAYYCLAKAIKSGNNYSAPILLNMLIHNPDAMFDKYFNAECEKCRGSLAYASMLLHRSLYKEIFKKDIEYIEFYVISLFYDIKKKKPLIPEDFFLTPQEKICKIIQNVISDNQYDNAISKGADFFERIYEEVKDTLLNF